MLLCQAAKLFREGRGSLPGLCGSWSGEVSGFWLKGTQNRFSGLIREAARGLRASFEFRSLQSWPIEKL